MDALRRCVARCAHNTTRLPCPRHHRCRNTAVVVRGLATSVRQEQDPREHATTQRERDDSERDAHQRAALRARAESNDEQQEIAERILRSHSFAQEFVKPHMDATFLVDNYTAPALAAAYQDRCV